MMAHDVEAAARAAWLELADRAMNESWTDRESSQAAKATIADLQARFGQDVDAFYALEMNLYRLFVHSPAADDVEDERRRVLGAAYAVPGA